MSIELPKDADGREIPLDTVVLFDKEGNPKDVSLFTYEPRSYSSGWNVVLAGGFERFASAMYLTPPDSWEKLEKDLERVVENKDAFHTKSCAYMNKAGAKCNDCRLHGHNTSNCTDEMFKDVVSRIRNLSGEDE